MYRGGRGGRGGGRGGAPGTSRLNHGSLPFEIDAELAAQADGMRKDQGLFPPLTVPKPQPLDKRAKQQVEDYRDLQLKFRQGPYYRNGSHIASRGGVLKERKNKSVFNAFEDSPSYLKQRAARAREFMEAEFDQLPWCKQMFPKELWEAIGAAQGVKYRPKTGRVNSKMDMKSRLNKYGDVADEDEQKERKPPDEDNESLNNDDNDAEGRQKDDDQESVEYDDTYEDGEDDMAGDYNAEQYFDGGDEDGDEGYDGGGGDDV